MGEKRGRSRGGLADLCFGGLAIHYADGMGEGVILGADQFYERQIVGAAACLSGQSRSRLRGLEKYWQREVILLR